MSKNRKYRDYTNFSQEEPKLTPAEEDVQDLENIIETVKEVREEPKEEVYIKKEEGDPSLEVNTFNNDSLKIGTINCPKLRVRTSESTAKNDNIIGIYEQGTKVTILQDKGEWLFVEIEKNSIQVRGFVMSKFIKR